MTHYETLLPRRTEKLPSAGGYLQPAWRGLDRATLMGLLAHVREDFLARWRERPFPEQPQRDAALSALVALRRTTLQVLNRVPDDLFTVVPHGETWSCHDLVNHLAIDEHNEFHPTPPAPLEHVILQEARHLGQAHRIARALGIAV